VTITRQDLICPRCMKVRPFNCDDTDAVCSSCGFTSNVHLLASKQPKLKLALAVANRVNPKKEPFNGVRVTTGIKWVDEVMADKLK